MTRYSATCTLLVLTAVLCAGAAEKPNVLMICVDDLRPELNCYGVDYIRSPNIDKLAADGRLFLNHYVQAPTCGASRYTLLTGRYSINDNNHALFARGKAIQDGDKTLPPSMPAWFRKNGYTTVSVGKVSHHPGGRGGSDWNDDAQPEMPDSWSRHLMPSGKWQHPRGIMHGLAHGEIRGKASAMALIQSEPGSDDIYPDGLITDEGLKQMDQLAKDGAPFFLAVGIIRPHLPFGAPAKYMEPYKNVKLPTTPHPEKPAWKSTWHGSGEFMKYKRVWKDNPKCNPNENAEYAEEVRKHYAACVTYADAQVGRLIAKLEKLKLRENTIVVLWGDHGWHLGEYGIWGKHALFEESLHSPLIIHAPGMKNGGNATRAVVEALDIFPTLCELSGMDAPAAIHGKSLNAMIENPNADGHTALSYRRGSATIRTSEFRIVEHKDGHTELYDFRKGSDRYMNVADKLPDIAARLKKELAKKVAIRMGTSTK